MTKAIIDEELLERRAAVGVLLRNRGDLLVVTGLGSPTYDVFAAGDHDGNFYLWGAMGGAALVGLGIAQAHPGRPERKSTSLNSSQYSASRMRTSAWNEAQAGVASGAAHTP